MYRSKEKAAPGATNTESGKEQDINLSVSLSRKKSQSLWNVRLLFHG